VFIKDGENTADIRTLLRLNGGADNHKVISRKDRIVLKGDGKTITLRAQEGNEDDLRRFCQNLLKKKGHSIHFDTKRAGHSLILRIRLGKF